MQIILENYLIIVLVGFFVVFALIGYLVDMFRNTKKNINNDENRTITNNEIEPVKLTNIEPENQLDNENKTEKEEEKDNLLNNYENE